MRIQGIDSLRGIAVLLVLARHSEWDNLIQKFGWLGVDLFFVISGFLVSGLLFAEYKKNNTLHIRRFLIRRGLKIYPSFYIFILVGACIQWFSGNKQPAVPLFLSEIFYVQNYFPNIYTHTWSLAVEEHFYIILALVSFLLLKKSFYNPLPKHIKYIFFLLVGFALLRAVEVLMGYEIDLRKTHLRTDGILIGIIVSYAYHFADWFSFLKKHKYSLLIFSLFCFLPGFIWDGENDIMKLIGLPIVNIGFGLLLIFSLLQNNSTKRIPVLRPLEIIGMHSYSIYLWHMMIGYYANTLLAPYKLSVELQALIYICSAVSIGIILSLLIEKTFLRLREKEWIKKWY